MLKKLLGNAKRKIRGVKKIDYQAYSLDFGNSDISEHALQVAQEIRGKNKKPAIIIHGIMQRSGTVFTGELIRLHPDLQAYPNDIWEFPFLPLTGNFQHAQQEFFQLYKENRGKIANDDFLPVIGASFIAYLYSYLPEEKQMLIKVPDVRYLNHFKTVFPYEYLLLLLRDGRDVVSSTIRTWPKKDFRQVCERWDLSTKMALKYNDLYGGEGNGFWLGRYEDAVNDPHAFITEACNHMGLDPGRYPFDKMDQVRLIGSSSQKKADGKVTWAGKEKPKNFNSLGRWKDWSQKDKDTFKKIAGESLINSGYCDNLDW